MDCFIDPVFSACYREQPLVMVDVGASGGVDRRWKRAARFLRIIAFEPDRRAFDALPEILARYQSRFGGQLRVRVTGSDGISTEKNGKFKVVKSLLP